TVITSSYRRQRSCAPARFAAYSGLRYLTWAAFSCSQEARDIDSAPMTLQVRLVALAFGLATPAQAFPALSRGIAAGPELGVAFMRPGPGLPAGPAIGASGLATSLRAASLLKPCGPLRLRASQRARLPSSDRCSTEL